MRASYTSAVVATLLRAGLEFPHVSGISAGASNTANYLSRDAERARTSFVEFAADPRFGNAVTFVQGKGLFNARYIYQETSRPGQALPFDFETFQTHPAQFRIGAVRTTDAQQVWFTRADIATVDDLMVRVRASSTMPGLMPPVEIAGQEYVDGAIGANGGIALDAARLDGYERFFVVLTRERSYVKSPPRSTRAIRLLFRRWPAVAEAVNQRWRNYNRLREELFDLESDGKALLYFPDQMPVNNREKEVAKLAASYGMGWRQAQRDLPRWLEFLGS